MGNLFATHSLKIAANHAVSGIAKHGQTLRVICGQVWITIEGSVEDYWLSSGESLELTPGRLVVIEADRLDSRVSVPAPAKDQGTGHVAIGSIRGLVQRLVHNGKALSS
ncbi:MAG TPA: DUF2917 domain-containing protein [Burkholderiaceae bacterium]|nr:DUF2917 domain-containing protein [Burkholderiaceae bacterium]